MIIAHRGSRELWPENTMESFSGAVDLGIEHIETDIHASSDGTVFCFHDHTVNRTTNGNGEFSALTGREIGRLDAGYRHWTGESHGYRSRGITVPTFEEVAVTFPDVRIVVDLKHDLVVEPFAKLVDRLGIGERIVVGSFSDDRLELFRTLTMGRIATSTGAVLSRQWLISSRFGWRGAGDAGALQLPLQMRGLKVVDEKLVAAAHDAGLQVHAWTVNDPVQAQALLEIGVDGLVTDRPDLMLPLV